MKKLMLKGKENRIPENVQILYSIKENY